MTTAVISKNEFYQALTNGLQTLVSHKRHLNEINVFPVADGDTGSNMASTAQTVLQQAQCGQNFKELLDNVANAAIRGARGNSGLILSDFFCELSKLSERLKTADSIPNTSLGKLIYQGAQQTINAIENPVEGTIITVMRAWGRALNDEADDTLSAKELFMRAQDKVEKVLLQTTNELKALKGTKLVDAGAQGFVYITRGITDFFCGKATFDVPDEENLTIEEEAHVISEIPVYRYCTEAFVEGDEAHIEALKETIKAHGNSFVFAATSSKARFHIHTNEPWKVFEEAQKIVQISSPKVDDMLSEYRTIHDRKSEIALVTDSSADLPKDLIDELQIYRIPINIQHGEQQFIDRVGMSTELLYQLMEDEEQYPTTSLPAGHQIEKVLSPIAKHYKQVIVISVAKKLSGTYEAIKRIASRYDNVSVFDSRSNAGGHGLQVYYAAKLIQQGLAVEAILERLNAARETHESLVYIKNMDALKRSGRISHFKALVARLSQLKTVIGVNREGRIEPLSKSFSESGAKKKLLDKIKKLHQKSLIKDYVILHVNTESEAKEFASQVAAIVGHPPLFIQTASPSISLHAGFGAISFASISY